MNFYYPWIDPRVKKVQPGQLIGYFRKHAWREEGMVREHFYRFRHPSGPSAVLVPTLVDADDLQLCILDAVTQLATIENRYAGEVLAELLEQPDAPVDARPAPPTVPQKGDELSQPANR